MAINKSNSNREFDSNMLKYSIGFNQILVSSTFVRYSKILGISHLLSIAITNWMYSIPCTSIPCT